MTEKVTFAPGSVMAGEFLEHGMNMDDKIAMLIAEVALAPLVVSETAISQLRPLLEELIARRAYTTERQ